MLNIVQGFGREAGEALASSKRIVDDQLALDAAVMAIAERIERRATQEAQLGQHAENTESGHTYKPLNAPIEPHR
ncbi:hypothetical protein U8L64_00370, partial [Pseudomonas sp. FIP_A4]